MFSHLYLLQLFSADATTFLNFSKIIFFAQENMKKPSLKVAHNRSLIFFFSLANWPKTSPNIIFCSTKMFSYIMFLLMTYCQRNSITELILFYNRCHLMHEKCKLDIDMCVRKVWFISKSIPLRTVGIETSVPIL